MKPIALHPVSVLAGLALATLAFLAMGSAQSPIPTKTVFVGEVPAEWWTYVELTGGPSSYTVPSGRHFVVTQTSTTSIMVNGQSTGALFAALSTDSGVGQNAGGGSRVAFPPGTVLTAGFASLWGYLEPLR